MAEENVDDELLCKAAIAAAIFLSFVTVASSKIITARKRERHMMWMREITFQRRKEYGAAIVRLWQNSGKMIWTDT